MTTLVTTIVVLIIIIAYISQSVRIVNEKQMAVITRLGKPIKKDKSGLVFVLWPIERIIFIPTVQQIINFETTTIITKRGKMKGYDKVIESTEINLPLTLGYYFDYDKLFELIANSPGISEREIAESVVPYLDDITRTIVGKIPYRLINEEGKKITQIILSRCFPFTDNDINYKIEKELCGEVFTFSISKNDIKLSIAKLKNSPFVKFGLTGITLSSSNVDFSDAELQKSISNMEKSSIEATTKKIDADVEAYKIEKTGAAEAAARKAMIEVIAKEKDMETLLTLREIAKGTSNTILYQLPRVFETKVAELLGGNTPGEAMKMLTPETKTELRNVILETIKSLKKSSGGK